MTVRIGAWIAPCDMNELVLAAEGELAGESGNGEASLASSAIFFPRMSPALSPSKPLRVELVLPTLSLASDSL
jgi:hypothetical protein